MFKNITYDDIEKYISDRAGVQSFLQHFACSTLRIIQLYAVQIYCIIKELSAEVAAWCVLVSPVDMLIINMFVYNVVVCLRGHSLSKQSEWILEDTSSFDL